MSPIRQPELQQRTLCFYGEFLCRLTHWGGQLAVAVFPGAASSGLAAAASLAGAASLTVDADAAAMKSHFRDGAYDFVVNTLDESLRALKNEIRRGRPIAIGLMADPESTLAEAVERGICAQLVLTDSSEATASEQGIVHAEGFFVQRAKPSAQLTAWLNEKRWTTAPFDEAQNQDDLQEADPRKQWLRNLPAHQRSVSKETRWSWITETCVKPSKTVAGKFSY